MEAILGQRDGSLAGTSKEEKAQAVAQAVGKAVVANELNEAHRHLDRAAAAATNTAAASASSATHHVSADSPSRFVDPSGDFAEEASYETASFPVGGKRKPSSNVRWRRMRRSKCSVSQIKLQQRRKQSWKYQKEGIRT